MVWREFYNQNKACGEGHVSEDLRFCFCEFFLPVPTLLYHVINRVEEVISKYIVSGTKCLNLAIIPINTLILFEALCKI